MLKNDGLEQGYTANQVGIYAEDPDDGEILLFISQAIDADSGTIIPSETEMPGYSAEWTFYFQYGQADSVEVVVDPTGGVTLTEMKQYVDAAVENKAEKDHTHNYAPFAHASPTYTYGKGTGAYFGHVQLSDATDSSKGTNDGVAATPAAVKAAYDKAKGMAPSAHASTTTAHGLGTDSKYGHVKLSDETNNASGVQGGTAATPAAVKAAYDLANSKAPAYSYGTEDLTAGSSPLETGKLYFVYE